MKILKTYKQLFENLDNLKYIIDTIKDKKFKLFKKYFNLTELSIIDIEKLLLQSMNYKNLKVFKFLVKKLGANYSDNVGNSILHLCVLYNFFEGFKYTLTLNCDLSKQNDDGDNIALYITYNLDYNNTYIKYLKLLLNYNFNWNIKNYDSEIDFIEKIQICCPNYIEYIKTTHIDKYKKYLRIKNMDKFNI